MRVLLQDALYMIELQSFDQTEGTTYNEICIVIRFLFSILLCMLQLYNVFKLNANLSTVFIVQRMFF